jgi:hypothetical protein
MKGTARSLGFEEKNVILFMIFEGFYEDEGMENLLQAES